MKYNLHNENGEKTTDNYHIIECSEFIPDSELKIDPKAVSDSGVIELLTAFGRRINLDYYNACLYLKADEHGIGVQDRKLFESKLVAEEAKKWISEPRRAKIEKMAEEDFAKGITKPQRGNKMEGFFNE